MSLPVVKLVILVGGPSKGTRFRPLSLDTPKPLFPVSDKPLIWHHVSASCANLQGQADLREIILIGFYERTAEWTKFCSSIEAEFSVPVRYLQEGGRTGTGGGINSFRNEIKSGNPEYFFVEHCDVVCSFPLGKILQSHRTSGKDVTILAKRVSPQEAHRYGCIVVNPETKQVVHYVEKPETFVTDIINCGVYLFSTQQFFSTVDEILQSVHREAGQDPNSLQLEQDFFQSHTSKLNCYETTEFWLQLKSAGMVIKCNEHFMNINANKLQLAKNSPGSYQVVGNVMVDATAKVDPTAKLGPNVSIGAGVVIGPGVRVSNSIILDGSEIKERACILFSVVGWKCTIGKWARLEGVPDFSSAGEERSNGITILGNGVSAANETVLRSSIVLPHKELSGTYANQILL